MGIMAWLNEVRGKDGKWEGGEGTVVVTAKGAKVDGADLIAHADKNGNFTVVDDKSAVVNKIMSSEGLTAEQIRDARFANKIAPSSEKTFDGFLQGGSRQTSPEEKAAWQAQLESSAQQLKSDMADRTASMRNDMIQKANDVNPVVGRHVAALANAGTDRAKFNSAVDDLTADKSVNKGNLTSISQIYGNHVSTGSKAEMVNYIERSFTRNARFEAKIQ